ncbi:uncharacterized protein LOC144138096 [Haemaphysalis longicornis]
MTSACCFAFLVVVAAFAPAASVSTNCANFAVSDVFSISSCLGGVVDICSPTNIVPGLTRLLRCVLTGIFNTGTPTGVLNVLGPIIGSFFSTFLGTFSSILPLGNLTLCQGQNCTNFFNTNVSCNSNITIRVPTVGNFASCFGSLNLCTIGSVASPQVITSFVNVITCLLGQLNPTQLFNIFTGVVCTLRQGLSGLGSLAGPLSGLVSALTSVLSLFFFFC